MTEAEELELLELEEEEAQAKTAKPKAPASSEVEPLRAAAPEPEPEAEGEPDYSKTESFGLGAGQGATLGFGDELAGGLEAIGGLGKRGLQAIGVMSPDERLSDEIRQGPVTISKRMGGNRSTIQSPERVSADTGAAPAPTFGEDYRSNRDRIREYVARSEAANPKSALAGNIAGSLLLPIKGPGALKGLKDVKGLAKLAAYGAGVGGVGGLGSSTADITKGDLGGAALDTGLGAGTGVAANLLTGTAGLGAKWLKGITGRGEAAAAKAAEDAAEQAAKKEAEKTASALGKARSKAQEASRDLEVLQREAAGDGPAAEDARKFLASPEAQALKESVLRSKLESAPDRIKQMLALKSEYELQKAAEAGAADAKTQEVLGNVWSRAVKPRVMNYVGRAVPSLVGGMVGNEIGGVPGAIIGGALGAGAGAALGRPGTALANALKDPGVRLRLAQTAQAIGVPLGGMGRFAEPLANAALKGPAALASAHYMLRKVYPEEYERQLEMAQAEATP